MLYAIAFFLKFFFDISLIAYNIYNRFCDWSFPGSACSVCGYFHGTDEDFEDIFRPAANAADAVAAAARANTSMARATFQSVKEARARRNAAAAATRAANRAVAALAARVAPAPVPAPAPAPVAPAPAPVAPAPIADRRAADACLSELMLSIFC